MEKVQPAEVEGPGATLKGPGAALEGPAVAPEVPAAALEVAGAVGKCVDASWFGTFVTCGQFIIDMQSSRAKESSDGRNMHC